MLPRNPYLHFLCSYIPIFLALILLSWTSFSVAYSDAFRSLAAVFYGDNDRRELSFSPLDDPNHPDYTRIEIANRALLKSDESGPVRHLDFDTIGLAYGPTAFLLALILATPISWKRRRMALLWGLLLEHIFILLALGFLIWNESSEISLVTLTPFWKHLATSFKDTLIALIIPSAPLMIWLLVTFKRQDFTVLDSLRLRQDERSHSNSRSIIT